MKPKTLRRAESFSSYFESPQMFKPERSPKKILLIIGAIYYIISRFWKPDSSCTKEENKRKRLISWNRLNVEECRISGGCLSDRNLCLSKEKWNFTPYQPNRFSTSKKNLDHCAGALICSKSMFSRCGSENTTESVCQKRSCCYHGNGICSIPIARGVSKVEADMFSIIISCYNQEHFIKDSIYSVLHQSYSKWELIIVDDGSFDKNCYKYVKKLRRKIIDSFSSIESKQIKLFFKKNTGLPYSRNWAAQFSSGSFFIFLDADDILAPTYLHNAATAIQKNHNSIVLYGDQLFFDSNFKSDIWITPPVQNLEVAAKKAPLGPLPTMSIVRADVFNITGGFSTEMIYGMEDYDLWLKTLRFQKKKQPHTRFIKLPGPQSWYRVNKNSMSRSTEYDTFALSMLRLKHSTLYNTLCTDLATIYCKANEDTMLNFEKVIYFDKGSCFALLYLSLLKMRSSCVNDVFILVGEAENFCMRKDNQITKLEMYRIKRIILRMFETKSFDNISIAPEKRCLMQFSKHCKRFQDTPDSTTEYSLTQKSRKNVYLPYFSTLNDRILDSISKLNASIYHSVSSYKTQKVVVRDVPNIIHFIYGFRGGRVTLSRYHVMNILSAYVHNQPSKIFFHCPKTPIGREWKRIESIVTVMKWNESSINAPRCFQAHAHLSDYLRLLVLYKFGGVYLDIDVLSFRKLNLSLNAEFGIAIQNSAKKGTLRERASYYGLCNAVLISVPKAKFLKTWIETYRYFRSTGKDNNWDEHSVRLPADILDEHRELRDNRYVSILPSAKFFSILWNDVDEFFAYYPECDINCFEEKWPAAEVFHLWTSSKNDSYGVKLDTALSSTKYENTLISAISNKLIKTSTKHNSRHSLTGKLRIIWAFFSITLIIIFLYVFLTRFLRSFRHEKLLHSVILFRWLKNS